MSVAITIYTALLGLSAVISVPIGGYVYQNRSDTVGARWLVLVFTGQTLWSGAYAVQLQLASAPLGMWMLFSRFVATGAAIVTASWLLFVLTYLGYDRRLSLPQTVLAVAPFVLTIGLAWTNQFHGLIWQLDPEPVVKTAGGGPYLVFEQGLWYPIWVAYSFLVVVAVLVMLGATYVRSRSIHRSQVGALFVAALVPAVGSGIFRTVDAGTLAIDVTPVLFTTTSVLVVIALTRYRMLSSVPVSQHVLLEQLSEGVVVTDETDEILHCNEVATQIFGGDVVGEDLTAQFADQQLAASQLADKPGDADQAPAGDELAVTVDGERRYFDVERTSYTDHRGQQRGAIYVFQDVTERREHAETLARQNERLDRFASMVGHDLRNPLGIAETYLEFAADSGQEDDFEAVREAHTRMDAMIDELLTLARAGKHVDETETVALADVARNSWQNVETDGASLEVSLSERATVDADPDGLLHVFENLFRNTVEHNDPPVSVRVGTLDAPGSTDGGVPDTGFYVEDDGEGIPPDQHQAVFEYGYTTRDGGTGFGLAIVRDVVRAQGWEIDITDSSEGGARFEIRTADTDDVSPDADGRHRVTQE